MAKLNYSSKRAFYWLSTAFYSIDYLFSKRYNFLSDTKRLNLAGLGVGRFWRVFFLFDFSKLFLPYFLKTSCIFQRTYIRNVLWRKKGFSSIKKMKSAFYKKKIIFLYGRFFVLIFLDDLYFVFFNYISQ